MLNLRCHEKRVACSCFKALSVDDDLTGASLHKIKFILIMRGLPVNALRRKYFDTHGTASHHGGKRQPLGIAGRRRAG